jgi:dipeptidyl aminopeptidase/acylaminoacyl peptidase
MLRNATWSITTPGRSKSEKANLRGAARSELTARAAKKVYGVLFCLTASISCGEEARSVTTRDAIEMTVPADPIFADEPWAHERVAQFSPDRGRFVVVLSHGDVNANTNWCEILLWLVADLRKGEFRPRTVAKLGSSSNVAAIRQVVWSSDNVTIWFVGGNQGEKQQVYSLDTDTGAIRRITNHPTNVLAFSHDASGTRIAYLAERAPVGIWNERTRRTGIVASAFPSTNLSGFVLGYEDAGVLYDRNEFATMDLFFADSGVTTKLSTKRKLPPAIAGALESNFALSPDGKHVIIATDVPLSEINVSWRALDDRSIRNAFAYNATDGKTVANGIGQAKWSYIEGYEILDTQTGRSRVLLNAPLSSDGRAFRPIWASDNESVVLSGLYLRPEQSNIYDERPIASRATRQTVQVHLSSGTIEAVGEKCYRALEWNRESNELTCLSPTNHPDGIARVPGAGGSWYANLTSRYQRTDGGWKAVRGSGVLNGDIKITVREDMNTPPKLFVRKGADASESLLLDLNPQFDELVFSKAEEVSIGWARGRKTMAGFYPPLNFIAGRRYPLVIQTHGWTKEQFQIEGFSTTGYATQALAARGLAVLQVSDIVYGDHDDPKEELNNAIAIYRSAIAFLDRRGIVDPHKVGLLGFSRTGDYLTWVLTQDPRLFAAASTAESTLGYVSFMSRQGGASFDISSLYGGPPIGRHLSTWLKYSPSFHLDRVRAPLRINVLCAPLFLPTAFEWFEGLTLLHKPVEMVMLESGEHEIVKPGERMTVSGGNVDWFDFWLNDHEDPNAGKSEQYARWHKLRELHEASQSTQEHN